MPCTALLPRRCMVPAACMQMQAKEAILMPGRPVAPTKPAAAASVSLPVKNNAILAECLEAVLDFRKEVDGGS